MVARRALASVRIDSPGGHAGKDAAMEDADVGKPRAALGSLKLRSKRKSLDMGLGSVKRSTSKEDVSSRSSAR